MHLKSLRVWHALKKEHSAESIAHLQRQALSSAPGLFCFDSCQRVLWVGDESDFLFGGEILCGVEAYSFLLRVVLGLESQVIAETDVFGQFKEAWRVWSDSSESSLAEDLSPWIQHLFQDAKELRARFLQNVGAGSYGSLLRKLLKQQVSEEPTLLIGAGRLANSVAPYLLEFGKLQIWNRTPQRSQDLAKSLRSEVECVESLSAALAGSNRIIVTVPASAQIDAEIIASRASRSGVVVHLGLLHSNASAWKNVQGFHPLDELFAMQSSMEQVRLERILEARRECEERAKHRALGGSLSMAHGWEDLAVFV